MTTGEKLGLLRKKKGITQEELAEVLGVSRQSVSRWERDAAFPETEKLIALSKLFECSIDLLLSNSALESEKSGLEISVKSCCKFIRECGYFFLATSVDDRPRLRPFGMIYSDSQALFIATDKRKKVYADLMSNSKMEIAAYQLNTRRWIRIGGRAVIENSGVVREEIMNRYPGFRQSYSAENEIYLAVFKIVIEEIDIM